MHEVLVICLFKLAKEKVWLGKLTHPTMTIAVDLGRKATKQNKRKKKRKHIKSGYESKIKMDLNQHILNTNGRFLLRNC